MSRFTSIRRIRIQIELYIGNWKYVKETNQRVHECPNGSVVIQIQIIIENRDIDYDYKPNYDQFHTNTYYKFRTKDNNNLANTRNTR